jgi:hypothetical protein
MKETDTITLRQLFDAFRKTFIDAGEVYYDDDPDCIRGDFLELLENAGVDNGLELYKAMSEKQPPSKIIGTHANTTEAPNDASARDSCG